MLKEKNLQIGSYLPAPPARRVWGTWHTLAVKDDPVAFLRTYLIDLKGRREGFLATPPPVSEKTVIRALLRLLPDERERIKHVLKELSQRSSFEDVRHLCTSLLAKDQ